MVAHHSPSQATEAPRKWGEGRGALTKRSTTVRQSIHISVGRLMNLAHKGRRGCRLPQGQRRERNVLKFGVSRLSELKFSESSLPLSLAKKLTFKKSEIASFGLHWQPCMVYTIMQKALFAIRVGNQIYSVSKGTFTCKEHHLFQEKGQ